MCVFNFFSDGDGCAWRKCGLAWECAGLGVFAAHSPACFDPFLGSSRGSQKTRRIKKALFCLVASCFPGVVETTPTHRLSHIFQESRWTPEEKQIHFFVSLLS